MKYEDLVAKREGKERHHNPSHDLEATPNRRPPAAPACVPQCCPDLSTSKLFYSNLHKSICAVLHVKRMPVVAATLNTT